MGWGFIRGGTTVLAGSAARCSPLDQHLTFRSRNDDFSVGARIGIAYHGTVDPAGRLQQAPSGEMPGSDLYQDDFRRMAVR